MRMKGVEVCALVGMVVGATLFGWSDADAALCVTKNKKGAVTKVTIRGGACKGKETVGDPGVLLGLATTTTSPTTTTTLAGLTGTRPRIVDSAGNEVGPLTSFGSFGVAALRTIDGQATIFPMGSDRPGLQAAGAAIFDDFQYQFAHPGTQCVGDRFALSNLGASLFGGDLARPAFPSGDGKSGYLFTSEVITEVSAGSYSEEDFKYDCAVGAPPFVTCDEDPPAVVTPVGAAFACQPPNTGLPTPPDTQCMCIRCCVTREVQPPDPPIKLYRVDTIDLGLGNSTPPFKVVP